MNPEDRSPEGMPGDEMNPPEAASPRVTGKVLVLFAEGATEAGIKTLKDSGGIHVSDLNEGGNEEDNQVYSRLEVAVIKPDPDQRSSIESASEETGSPILLMEDEQIIGIDPHIGVQELDTTSSTWGLSATNVLHSSYSGNGIKVAILDTGFDFNHPDFTDRSINKASFVKDEDAQDGHGHGTHCTGTACGPKKNRSSSTRYGVAYDASIYIGKVLNNRGQGADGSILAGIEWAVEQGCQIISMSIGGRVSVNQSYSQVYETIAYRALEAGTLIIAAAGNDSRRTLRPSIINPVSRPANVPSIMAVGAIDSALGIAPFSNGAINVAVKGGEVNIAGPGVNVYSSFPMNLGTYKSISGTSMATPHVAGIAALYAEARPEVRGQALWDLLIEHVKPLGKLNSRDVGSGLIQAP